MKSGREKSTHQGEQRQGHEATPEEEEAYEGVTLTDTKRGDDLDMIAFSEVRSVTRERGGGGTRRVTPGKLTTDNLRVDMVEQLYSLYRTSIYIKYNVIDN